MAWPGLVAAGDIENELGVLMMVLMLRTSSE